MIDRDLLARCAAPFEVEVTPALCDRLDIYGRLLVEWNEKMNLTAITDPLGIAVKHFYDSLLFLVAADIPQGARVIDVGTGAGFPGMVLKIVRPDIKVTLLDSLNKRIVIFYIVCPFPKAGKYGMLWA